MAKKIPYKSLADAKPKQDPIAQSSHRIKLAKACMLYKENKGQAPSADLYLLLDGLTLDQLTSLINIVQQLMNGENIPHAKYRSTHNNGWVETQDFLVSPKNSNESWIIDQVAKNLLKKQNESLLQKIFKGPDTKHFNNLIQENPLPYPIKPAKDIFDERDMVWTPKGKEPMMASQMSALHLFHSLRIVFNQCVPTDCRLMVESRGRFEVQVDGNRKHTMKVFFYLLKDRVEELADEHVEQLIYMSKIVKEKL